MTQDLENKTATEQRQHKPLVSIGMPVYNGAKFIREALDSLLAQTFTDFELIISDNASTDETETICREYAAKDKRIRYIRQPENRGGVANFQFVLDEAAGEYFMWAAHDDLWVIDYLENATSMLRDDSLCFVFPAFRLASKHLFLTKRIDESIFSFIEDTNCRRRVLNFFVLHHSSHKCNLVYSLFKINFLRRCYKIQNIANDGLLAAVILEQGMGGLLKKTSFIKRYENLWPGCLDYLYRLFGITTPDFEEAKKIACSRALALFPQYKREIQRIFSEYKEYSYQKRYKIYNIAELDNE